MIKELYTKEILNMINNTMKYYLFVIQLNPLGIIGQMKCFCVCMFKKKHIFDLVHMAAITSQNFPNY